MCSCICLLVLGYWLLVLILLLPLREFSYICRLDLCSAEVATWLTHVLSHPCGRIPDMHTHIIHTILKASRVAVVVCDMLIFSLLMLLTHSLWIGGAKCATCVAASTSASNLQRRSIFPISFYLYVNVILSEAVVSLSRSIPASLSNLICKNRLIYRFNRKKQLM